MASPSPSPHVSAPAAGPSAAPVKPPRILACVLCQQRKIKCDRNFPCAHCTKANVKCTPSTPAPPRKRRRPNQDLQERLARCEELLSQYAAEKPEHRASQLRAYGSDQSLQWQPTGKLVRENGSMRFMDSPLLGNVYDELRAMKKIVDAEDSDDSGPDDMTPDDNDNSDLLLGGDTPEVKIESIWPDGSQVFRLWQVYLDRVNPLTKVIHVPTLQPFVAEAASDARTVPKNIEALLFSIFVMAVVALTPDECKSMLGIPREEALQKYSRAVRMCLVRMGFLKSHDLPTLQALVIYLISLQGRYNRHAAWILNGVAIRIAQKMGLHRDGETLGLSPFECEMRRRLWWQIVVLDSKYALFSGLTHSMLPRNSDTQLPRNVNDADFFPSGTEPIRDRDGPTEMIFCLLTYKSARFLVNTPGCESVVFMTETEAGSGQGGPTEAQLAGYRYRFEQFGKELVETLDRYCDPSAGPVHEMALAMKKPIVDKIKELITPPRLRPEWGGEVRSAKDNTFKIAISTLEHNEANYISTKDKGFVWFSLMHFNLDVFMYLAGQLCHRTEGSLVERAWRQVDVVYSYHPELFDVTNKNYAMLAVFILKAWKKREEAILGRTGRIPETPYYVEKLRACMPNEDYKSEPTPPNPYTPSTLTTAPDFGMTGGELDQFINSLDVPTLGWDMIVGQPFDPSSQGLQSFGAFGMGPSVDW